MASDAIPCALIVMGVSGSGKSTIADALGVPAPGSAASTFPINGIWNGLTPVVPSSWGRLKMLYR